MDRSGGADRRQHLDVAGAVLLSVLAAATITLLHSVSAYLVPPVLLVIAGLAICAARERAASRGRAPTTPAPAQAIGAQPR